MMSRYALFIVIVCFLGLPGSADAVVLDLTTAGSSGSINGGIFQQYSPRATGSGKIDSFVRIHSFGVQQGYNTDYRPVEFDEDTTATFTHSLLVSEVPTVNINGSYYLEFLLDINQNGQNILSMDALEIAVHDSGNLTDYSVLFASTVYDLDSGVDNWVLLDYSLNGGSGQGDLLAYIPESLFEGLGDYIYLYSRFGENSAADDGFEEWARGVGEPVIPEPSTILFLGFGWLFLGRKRRMSCKK